ncbi:MAG: hypothetical protein RR310_02065 [Eubacterium sp.]
MLGKKPILKFTKVQEADAPTEIVDMELTEFTWPKGGIGICPLCGGKVNGVGKEWACEECDLKLNGPIF